MSEELNFPPIVVLKSVVNGRYLLPHPNFGPYQYWASLAEGEKHNSWCKVEVIKEGQYYTIKYLGLQEKPYWHSERNGSIVTLSNYASRSFYKVVNFHDGHFAFLCKDTNKYADINTDANHSRQLMSIRTAVETSTKFLVEEPVIKRTVRNVVFDLEKATVSDMEGLTLENVLLKNNSSHSADLTHMFNYTEETTTTWNNSFSVGAEVSTEFKTGVPFIAEGKISVSVSTNFTTEWGKSETKSKSSTPSATAKDIPPGGSVRITFYATKAKATVPFRYEQIDYYSDGSVSDPKVLDKGTFTGVNNFDFNYEITDTRVINGMLMDLPRNLKLPAQESFPVEE